MPAVAVCQVEGGAIKRQTVLMQFGNAVHHTSTMAEQEAHNQNRGHRRAGCQHDDASSLFVDKLKLSQQNDSASHLRKDYLALDCNIRSGRIFFFFVAGGSLRP